MAAIDDLHNVATRLENVANALGSAANAASSIVKTHTDSQAAIGQHVSRLNAVAIAVANAAAALTEALKS